MIKKIFKYFLISALVILAFFGASFIVNPTNYICSSESLSEYSRNVNFYDYDNNLLYSVNVPIGMTLNEYQNLNMVNNSALTVSNIPITSNRELGFYSFTNYTIDTNGYHFSTSSAWAGLNYSFSFDEVKNDVYFKILVKSDSNNSNHLGIYSRYFNEDETLVNLNYQLVLNNRLTENYSEFTYIFPYVEDYSFCSFNIWNNSSSGELKSYSIDYISLSPYNYSYYSLDYVNKLYNRQYDLTLNDSVYWYLNNELYDFNKPITSDINLYGSSNLYHKLNIYAEDRLTLIYSSDKFINGSNIFANDPINFTLNIKYPYFLNQSKYKDINDFNLLFTDNYYSYDNYFNEYFRILEDTDLYCHAVPTNINYFDSSEFTTFYYIGDKPNLLNSYSISAIKFAVAEVIPLNSTYLCRYEATSNIYNLPLNESVYNEFTDIYNNTYYYRVYTETSNNRVYYSIFLYRINLENPEKLCFYPAPPDLFTYDNKYLYNIFSVESKNCYYYIKYNVDYNLQYYYADYFGFSFSAHNDIIDLTYYDTNSNAYLLGDYNSMQVGEVYGIKSDNLLNSYINSFSFNILPFIEFNGVPGVYSDYLDYIYSRCSALTFIGDKIYFYQTNTQSNGNNIIPTDTSGLYKTKQNWYDFGTDIYNMFVYIIFEAPFISDIVKLIYILINLIINVFTIIINLFKSVSSTIFISMIVGFIVLRFIFKKFLGGSS